MDVTAKLNELWAAERAAEELASNMSAACSRILKVVANTNFRGKRIDDRFDPDSFTTNIIGTHLIPSYFDSFRTDRNDDTDEEVIIAVGTYYGTHGFYETQHVRIPKAWFDMTDDQITLDVITRCANTVELRERRAKRLLTLQGTTTRRTEGNRER